MSFAEPLWLLALPLIAGLALLLRRGGALAAQLPGQWDLLVDPALRRPLARGLGAGDPRRALSAPAAAAALIALALARPMLDAAAPPAPPDLAGRVIVVEAAPGADAAAQRRLAERLLGGGAPPTALVASAGEGYDAVPLTADRRHLERYLAVLAPELMPEAGRNPAAGLVHAEAALARAGVAVGQVVLIPAGPPPAGMAAPPAGPGLRAVLAPAPLHAAWAGTAEAWGARLAAPDEAGAIADDLDAAAAAALRASVPGGAADLRPWLAALAALVWLALFRRSAAT